MKGLFFNRIIIMLVSSIALLSQSAYAQPLVTAYDTRFNTTFGWTSATLATTTTVNASQNGATFGGGNGIVIDVAATQGTYTGKVTLGSGGNRWMDLPPIAFTNNLAATSAGTLTLTWYAGSSRSFSYYIVNTQGLTIAASGTIDGTSASLPSSTINTVTLTLPPITGTQVLKLAPSGSSVDLLAVTVQTYLNEPNVTPVINAQSFSVNECSSIGTSVGTVAASDGNTWQTISYSITGGNTGNVFAINSSTGQITVNGALDFETKTSYPLTVQVADNYVPSASSSATVTVNITNCNNENAPVINPQTLTVIENSPIGSPVGTISLTDPNPNPKVFSITSGNTGNAFAINSTTGAIRVNGPINFEALSSYNLGISIVENGDVVQTTSGTVAINVTDVNENPSTPVIANQTFSINENSPLGTIVDTVAASDADLGQLLTYSITAGNTNNVFVINSSTGVITVNGVLDFETPPTSYPLTVKVVDNGQPTKSNSATVTININDVADPNLNNPVMPDQTFAVDENSSAGTVVGTLTATDVEWFETLTYSVIAASPSNPFTLSPSGLLTVTNYNSLDFETTPSYALTVVVSDNGTDTVRTDTATVTVNINNLLIESGATSFPFKQRTVLNGPYDIQMIAAPNLQAVFLDATQAASGNLLADSLITENILRRTGNLMEINNTYKGGSPFVQKNIPLPAILCTGNPDVGGCVAGFKTVTPPSSGCTVEYNGSNTVSRYVSMTYADYDTDLSTYSSSMAQLNASSCNAKIERAYLYWSGNFKGANPNITLVDGPLNTFSGSGSTVFNTSTTSGHNSVLFKVPGGSYQTVTATAGNTYNITIQSKIRQYMCVADVTNMLQGVTNGQFWVANIQSYPDENDGGNGGGSSSGWTLVVVYQSPLSAPRMISIWDGMENIIKNTSQNLTLTGLTTPTTTNFNSYMGFAALDGENLATQSGVIGNQEGLGVQTFPNGTYTEVNPFNPLDPLGQPGYKLYSKEGFPAQCDDSKNEGSNCGEPLYDANWCTSFDGVSSSHITTYTSASGKNGNEITRLPSVKNTLGYDSHHIKLPDGTVKPGDNSATLTVQAGPQGGTVPFLAYVAIESVEPKLDLTKAADTSSVTKGTPFAYILTVRNQGTAISLGNDSITDNLPIELDYNGSFVATKYVNSVPSPATVTLVSNVNDNLTFNLADPIGVHDSIVIKLNVKVISDSLQLACKKEITNIAYLIYTGSSGNITVQSNSSGCSVDSVATVTIFPRVGGELFNVSSVDVCALANTDVIAQIQNDLIGYDPALSAPLLAGLIEIKDEKFAVVPAGTLFPALNGTLKYYAILPGNCDKVYAFTYECDAEVFIPNLISPGTDLKNDVFEIKGLNPDTHVQIFNRWGKLVYNSKSYTNDWKPENGEEGVYFYHIDDPKRKKEWKGWLHVVNGK